MGPLRVSNVLRPDNRVAGPWVGWAHGGVCSVCGRAQWPWRVLGTVGGCRGGVLRAVGPDGLWIVPLCLILTEFFPPFSARVETSAQKPLICGDNAYAVGLMFGVRGK